jgi:hypothetical protein
MARFDPAQRAWPMRSGRTLEAETAFADRPSRCSDLDCLAARVEPSALLAPGHDAVSMQRFRPNIVLDGFSVAPRRGLLRRARDRVRPDGPVLLKWSNPAGADHRAPTSTPRRRAGALPVADTLAGYRADARIGGALAFGMEMLIVSSRASRHRLRVGARAKRHSSPSEASIVGPRHGLPETGSCIVIAVAIGARPGTRPVPVEATRRPEAGLL